VLNSFFFALLILFYFVSSFVFSFRVFCPRGLSALCPSLWSVRSSSRVTVFASAVPVVLNVGLCCWHTVCSGRPFSGRASICLRSTGSSAYCLAVWRFDGLPTTPCIEGSRRSAVISLCRLLWRPLAAAAEGADSFTSRLGCLRRGEHRSAPVQECGLALLSRLTVLASMSAPHFNSRRVSSPRTQRRRPVQKSF